MGWRGAHLALAAVDLEDVHAGGLEHLGHELRLARRGEEANHLRRNTRRPAPRHSNRARFARVRAPLSPALDARCPSESRPLSSRQLAAVARTRARERASERAPCSRWGSRGCAAARRRTCSKRCRQRAPSGGTGPPARWSASPRPPCPPPSTASAHVRSTDARAGYAHTQLAMRPCCRSPLAAGKDRQRSCTSASRQAPPGVSSGGGRTWWRAPAARSGPGPSRPAGRWR